VNAPHARGREVPASLSPGADRLRRVELRQLQPAVAGRCPHHSDVDSDIFESDDADATAASRSSTTTPTLSIRWIVIAPKVVISHCGVS
jgi:hypothetical protein